MKGKKILLIIPSLNRVGPINVAYNIIKNCKNIHVTILSLNGGPLYDDFKSISNNIIVKDFYNAVIYCIRNRHEFDVVHSHCVVPDLINSIFFKNKSITTLHNFIYLDYISERGRLKGTIISCLHLFCLKRIGTVVACSNSVKDYIYEKFNINSLAIRNGVEPSLFVKKGIVDENINFLIVGVFNERKNHEVAIEGFLAANLNNSTLILCGDGPFLNEYIKRYNKYDNVLFLGNVCNPREYMSQADVLLSSSKAEGLPMALLEGIAEGLSYIVSDIKPHEEVYNLEPKLGFVVENSIIGFSDEISRFTKNKAKERYSLAKLTYTSFFSSIKMANKYMSLYLGGGK